MNLARDVGALFLADGEKPPCQVSEVLPGLAERFLAQLECPHRLVALSHVAHDDQDLVDLGRDHARLEIPITLLEWKLVLGDLDLSRGHQSVERLLRLPGRFRREDVGGAAADELFGSEEQLAGISRVEAQELPLWRQGGKGGPAMP